MESARGSFEHFMVVCDRVGGGRWLPWIAGGSWPYVSGQLGRSLVVLPALEKASIES